MRQSPRPSTKENTRVPEFLPFRGLRYAGSADRSAVTAPPYDVIDDDEHAALERKDPRNAVRLILPREDGGTTDRYEVARAQLAAWQAEGTLTFDGEAAFYAYRMTFEDDGATRHTIGVIGALGLPDKAGEGDVLPHERTLPKARSDRLALLRATRANLDPIWGLSLAVGLTAAIGGLAVEARAVDDEGTLHELAVLRDPDQVETIRGLVAGAPVVLADGHHRFETACAYRAEQPGDPGAAAIMTLVVELADEQLCVRPIHRLVHGLSPDGAGDVPLRARLSEAFIVEDAGSNTPDAVHALVGRMHADGALGLVDAEGLAVLRPRDDVLDPRLAELPAPLHDVDSARFDVGARPVLGDATLGYRADAATVAALVDKGTADAAILLRPVSVATIRAAAFAGVRMPEKTTFFHPKPRTGMVFRTLDA
jgi:uncharacterized protein (DUF1015 family)